MCNHDPNLDHEEPEQVRRLLSSVGLDSMVDIHAHFMPKPVMDKVWAYFDNLGPLTGRPWPITYRHDEQARIDTLRAFGVEAFTSMIYPHKAGMAAWLNHWATDFAERTPDCLHTATFYPEPDAATYVQTALEAGARVFKAHIQVGHYDPNHPLLDPVWDQLQETGTPVVIHAGNGPTPGPYTGPEGMQRLLNRYPSLTLVMAHMGLPDYSDFLHLAEQHDRVHLDTTMVFTPFTEQRNPFPDSEKERLVRLGHRVLFGSDFPNIPYTYAQAVEAVIGLELGDEWSRAVLRDNARRLFGTG